MTHITEEKIDYLFNSKKSMNLLFEYSKFMDYIIIYVLFLFIKKRRDLLIYVYQRFCHSEELGTKNLAFIALDFSLYSE